MANRIRELRKEKNLTQLELAKKLNVSDRSVGFYESGERDPDTGTLCKLAEIFNCSIDYLLGHTDIRNPYSNENKDLLKNLDDDTKKILEDAKNLSPKSKDMLQEYIDVLKFKEMKEKNEEKISDNKAL